MHYEVLPGGTKLMEQLEEISKRADDFAPAFALVTESFREIEARRFANNGPGWLPLSAATMAMTGSWARQNQNFDEILQDTGALLRSLEGGPGSYTLATPFSIEMGTTIPYAHWHQTGGTTPGRPPQRKIVDVSMDEAIAWGGIIEGYLMFGELELQTV